MLRGFYNRGSIKAARSALRLTTVHLPTYTTASMRHYSPKAGTEMMRTEVINSTFSSAEVFRKDNFKF